MHLSGQQWVFRNLKFRGTLTGVIAGGTNIVFLGCSFEAGDVAIKADSTSGSLTVIDSTGSNMRTFITSNDSHSAGNAIILDNVENSGDTVKLGDKVVLSGRTSGTWVHGTLVRVANHPAENIVLTLYTVPASPRADPKSGRPNGPDKPIFFFALRKQVFHYGAANLSGV
jgi:hypothetical protein